LVPIWSERGPKRPPGVVSEAATPGRDREKKSRLLFAGGGGDVIALLDALREFQAHLDRVERLNAELEDPQLYEHAVIVRLGLRHWRERAHELAVDRDLMTDLEYALEEVAGA